MWAEIISGGFLLSQYIYHRWIEDHPPPKPPKDLPTPRVDEGGVIPLIYGKCMVRGAYLAYSGPPGATPGGVIIGESFPFIYDLNMFFVLGIPSDNGFNQILNIWIGEMRLLNTGLSSLLGYGNFETDVIADNFGNGSAEIGYIGGSVEFLNGRSTQQLANPNPPYNTTTSIGSDMVLDGIPASILPGYRGKMCLYLHNGWYIGASPNPGAYSFECSAIPFLSKIGLFSPAIGEEMNPAEVIYDLLTGSFGKLKLPVTLIDGTSFNIAGYKLLFENHGYSHSIEEVKTAGEIINDILKQIDGILGEADDGRIFLKLIRPDYDIPSALPNINPSNCKELRSLAAGGWENIINKVRIIYDDRQNGYREASVFAENQANSSNQDGQAVEVVLKFPGIKSKELAEKVGSRELTARSRPISKCSAIIDRSFIRLRDGDAIAVTWPEYEWDRLVFRVVRTNRGLADENYVTVDLIQDFYYIRGLGDAGDLLPAFPADVHGL